MSAVLTLGTIVERVRRARLRRVPAAGLAYRSGEGQRCPGCGGRAWIVRTITAECARCAAALPLAAAPLNGGCGVLSSQGDD